jgi:hypothetical protein
MASGTPHSTKADSNRSRTASAFVVQVPAPITYGTPLSGTQLNATASVAGSLAYSPAAGTVLTAGSQTLSVLFTPTDTTDYTTASASVSLQVNQATPTITWANPAPITYPTPLSATQLNATASVPGNFVYTPPAGTVLGGGTQTLSVMFTPTDNTDYATATKSVSLTVKPASQLISFTMSAPQTAAYNSSFAVAATASSGLPVTFTSAGPCTNSGVTYTMTSGAGTCTVAANPAGNSNYLAAPPAHQFTTAIKASPTVSLTGAPAKAPYNSMFTLTATTNATTTAVITTNNSATCSLSGSSSPATVTILKDTGTCKFTAMWPADANYASASTSQTTAAEKASPVITWTSPASITYGTPLSATQLDATADVAGTFTYRPAAGSIENTGSVTLKATFHPSNLNYNTATASVTLQVLQTTTTTITSPSSTVTMNIDGIAAATLNFNVSSYRPTGAVTLTATTGEVCSGSPNTSGNGGCKLTFNTTGTRTFTASYGGDSNHIGSNSSAQNPQITVTVNPH